MLKKTAIVLVLILIAAAAWALYVDGSSTQLTINGHEVTGPLKGAVGVGGLFVASVSIFAAAILLIFVFAGIGLFIVGGIIVLGLIAAGIMFPLMLFLLVPLTVVWFFIAAARK